MAAVQRCRWAGVLVRPRSRRQRPWARRRRRREAGGCRHRPHPPPPAVYNTGMRQRVCRGAAPRSVACGIPAWQPPRVDIAAGWLAGIADMAAGVGCPGRAPPTPPHLLCVMHNRGQVTSRGRGAVQRRGLTAQRSAGGQPLAVAVDSERAWGRRRAAGSVGASWAWGTPSHHCTNMCTRCERQRRGLHVTVCSPRGGGATTHAHIAAGRRIRWRHGVRRGWQVPRPARPAATPQHLLHVCYTRQRSAGHAGLQHARTRALPPRRQCGNRGCPSDAAAGGGPAGYRRAGLASRRAHTHTTMRGTTQQCEVTQRGAARRGCPTAATQRHRAVPSRVGQFGPCGDRATHRVPDAAAPFAACVQQC